MNQQDNQPKTEGLDFNGDYEVHNSKRKPFPGKYSDEPRVFFEPEVFAELKEHASETVAVELCGVLVGTTCQDDSGKYLLINGSIRGKHARNEGAQVAFTHETWDYIHSEMEKNFKGRAIVGWYHTHPGFGIFLSDMDKFIQDYFFNQPFQVALVIDPINSKQGLFAWIAGKTRALSRCWVGEEVQKLTQGAVGSEEIREKFPAQAEYSQQSDASAARPENKSEKNDDDGESYRLLPLALAFLIGLSLSMIMMRSTFFQAAMMASRAETRELLGAWAADTAATEELHQLQGRLAAFSDDFHNKMCVSSEFASAAAELSSGLSGIQIRLDEIASSSAERRDRVHRILEAASTQTVRQYENLEELRRELNSLKETTAKTLLMQLTPYLMALSTGQLDANRLNEAKAIVRQIIELDPQLEPTLREKLPQLF